jgi:hypothetical protein
MTVSIAVAVAAVGDAAGGGLVDQARDHLHLRWQRLAIGLLDKVQFNGPGQFRRRFIRWEDILHANLDVTARSIDPADHNNDRIFV